MMQIEQEMGNLKLNRQLNSQYWLVWEEIGKQFFFWGGGLVGDLIYCWHWGGWRGVGLVAKREEELEDYRWCG
jgi:hypothetical protein